MGLRVGGGARVADGATASETFTAPSGMTIADFTLTRQLTYRNGAPASGTRPLFALYRLGGTTFAGAGRYQNATRDRLHAQGSWYGYPESNVVVPRSTVSRASFPALAGYTGNAKTLQIMVGCYNGPKATPCTTAGGGSIANLISGARVVLNDPTRPAASVEASGLLSGGRRNGSDAVTLDAGDNGGIRRVEIIDLSGGGIVGGEDYGAGARTAPARPARRASSKACPNLSNETVRPTKLAAGRRTLKVRVTDAAGNITEQGPYVVDVVTPSDRGPLNGSGATDGGSLTAHFSGKRKRHKTVGYRKRVRVSGRLLNSAGKPISGALLKILTRDRRSGAHFVQRWATTTKSDGSYKLRVRAGASRLVQVAWALAHPRPEPAGERLPDAQRARVVVAARDAPGGRRRPDAAAARQGARRGPQARRAGDLPGPQRRRTLRDVRRRPRERQGALHRPLPLPLRLFARADVHVPREAPRRRALPVRARILQARAGPSALKSR